MRVLIVYGCLFPYTSAGGEHWYRNLAQRLAADGHEVTYLTLRQWDRAERPALPGVDVRVGGPRMALYVRGRRRLGPPLVFGAGVLLHLLRRGKRYELPGPLRREELRLDRGRAGRRPLTSLRLFSHT